MKNANINGTRIAYEECGEGEPALLIHCSFVARAFDLMMREPSLHGYRLIAYHRRGYGESDPTTPLSLEEQARDALTLLDHLGVERAHIVGHSHGGVIALQLALAAPQRAQTLTLIEPTLSFFTSPALLNVFGGILGQVYEKFGAGDVAGAAETFLTGAFGPGFREITDRNLPGSWAQIVKDCPTALGVDAPSLQTWGIGPTNLARINTPALSIFHMDAVPFFQEMHEGMAQSMPHVESLVIPNVTHLMQIADPRSVAEGVAGFLARHAMKGAV